jgi:predicted nucleic acid-binding protein
MSKNIDINKVERVKSILSLATIYVNSTEKIKKRAKELMQFSFKFYDALHLSFAEKAEVDVFLTTDDRLFRKAKQYNSIIQIEVDNPVSWLINVLQSQGDNDEIS